eukprot:g15060.t1
MSASAGPGGRLGTHRELQELCRPVECTDPAFDPGQLFTSQAHLLQNGCLYAALDPYKTALDLSKEYLAMCNYEPEKEVDAYEKKCAIYEADLAEWNALKKPDPSKRPSKPDVPYVPQHWLPNFKHHAMWFAEKAKVHPSRATSPAVLEVVRSLIRVSESPLIERSKLIKLLCLGVGVYAPRQLPNAYTQYVLQCADQEQLFVLFAGKEIVYGTNLPFANVVIEPAFAESSSQGTLFQLMGRAGRVGHSYSCQVLVLDEKTAGRFRSREPELQEANALNHAYAFVTGERFVPAVRDCVPMSSLCDASSVVIRDRGCPQYVHVVNIYDRLRWIAIAEINGSNVTQGATTRGVLTADAWTRTFEEAPPLHHAEIGRFPRTVLTINALTHGPADSQIETKSEDEAQRADNEAPHQEVNVLCPPEPVSMTVTTDMNGNDPLPNPLRNAVQSHECSLP